MKILIALSLLMTTPVFAQTIEQEITEGKIQAAEADFQKTRVEEERLKMEKEVEDKMQKALILISRVAELANDRVSIGSDSIREDAEFANTGYIAIIQSIREDREALAKRFIEPDTKTLKTYSKRLDYIILDAQALLK